MRVLVAGRLSRKVADRDQTGFDSQERESVEWAKRELHKVVAVVADFKTGRSGLEARKNLRPWVTDPVKLSQYDAIVALKVDRLTRGNREETSDLEKWARDHGKMLFIVGSDVKFPAEGNDGAMWDFMLRQAHQEWLNTSERYTRMLRTRRNAGSFVGRPPYGYRIAYGTNADGQRIKTLVKDDAEADIIRDAAKWYLKGASLEDIAMRLTDAGRLPRLMSNKHQPTWRAQTLAGALRNEAVIGRRNNGRGSVLKCEPILDRDTYARVVERMRIRAKRKGVSQAKSTALLTSIIKCGEHSRNMYKTGQGYYCHAKGCKAWVRLAYADGFVNSAMAKIDRRDLIEIVIPGSNHKHEIDDLEADMTDAIQRRDFASLPALQAEIERLEAMPVEPDRVERRESDQTVADAWAAMASDSERRAFLIERGATLTVEYRADGTQRRLVFGGPWVRMAA